MKSLVFVFLLGQQIFSPHSHSVSTLPEREKAAIRDAAGTYWRSVNGSNVWLAPLVSWDMNPGGRPRPLTNWTRVVGIATPHGNNLLVRQEMGRTPMTLLLTNLPPERVKANRVNAYAVVRKGEVVNANGLRVPVYDFGKIIDPPARINATGANYTISITNPPPRTRR